MGKVLLWLDDYRNPFKDDWLNFSPIGKDCDVVWVTSYEGFRHWIMVNGLPDAICFDHDLGSIVEDWDFYPSDNRYECSTLGRIKFNGIEVKQYYGKNGATFAHFDKENNRSIKLSHRFIAETFIPNQYPLINNQINHLDGNRWNNLITNLEWCTNSENVQHSHDNLDRSFTAYGENHGNSKTVSQYSKDGKLINVYGSVNEAGRQLNIQFTNIAKCARGERKTAGTFVWKYENLVPTIESEIKHIIVDSIDKFSVPNFNELVEMTGYDCAKFLVKYCLLHKKPLPLYSVQSANPVGKENIITYLENFKKYV